MLARSAVALVLGLGLSASAEAQGARAVVFDEPGFPVVESAAVPREVLDEALSGFDVAFAGLAEIGRPGALEGADLLVLPHGSAFPADAWDAIRAYLEGGGNLLTLGGRPLYVPVFAEADGYRAGRPTPEYWRLLAAVEAAEVRLPAATRSRFVWDPVWGFEAVELRARRVFAVTTLFVANFSAPEGSWRGLGHLVDANGWRLAAPVTRLDFSLVPAGARPRGHGRLVMLTFDPEPGYWSSAGGRSLLRQSARHAALGPALVRAVPGRATLREDESADAVVQVHDRRQPRDPSQPRQVRVELRRDGRVIEAKRIVVRADQSSTRLSFARTREPGLYEVRATYERDGGIVDVHETGFFRRAQGDLRRGARLTAGPTYLRRDGRPFLPVGVNHWVNDSVWPFFPENANALEWDRDFAEMETRGFTFVRTGIWFDRIRLVDRPTGTAREEVLRNIEALLVAAGRHGLHVQFTFFSFEPLSLMRSFPEGPAEGRNPYTDPVATAAQKTFVRSIVERFRDVPFLSWDLINEPSFSNRLALWRGNQPNRDPTEVASWNEWLRGRYETDAALAAAWGIRPGAVRLGAAPLPEPRDLSLTRNGNPDQVRALDYNLFAQHAFSAWVGEMVGTIREAGSQQLVAVGQDEGGVTSRLLNQFYGGADVDMTSMHNWWQDDALLWDAVAAKRPGVPNLLGETSPQPAIGMDGKTRWDETRGLALFERKLALGLAAGNGGALAWIWSRSDPYHLGRPDGSTTPWVDALTGLARFAADAEPYLSEARPSEVTIVLPQSLQLSVLGHFGIEAQQRCVRALYHHARAAADVVGEYQIDLLGQPRLIVLPSPWVLDEHAWDVILERVRAGSTLLVSGRFDADAHFQPTDRAVEVGLDYEPDLLAARAHVVRWPGGEGRITFSGDKTTYLERARLPGDATFQRDAVGQGQILFFSLPLELGDEVALLGRIYRFALEQAEVEPVYRTALDDPGVAIVPTPLQTATLYVLTSESAEREDVTFEDTASGRDIRVDILPGRAALRLVTHGGETVAGYGGAGETR